MKRAFEFDTDSKWIGELKILLILGFFAIIAFAIHLGWNTYIDIGNVRGDHNIFFTALYGIGGLIVARIELSIGMAGIEFLDNINNIAKEMHTLKNNLTNR